MNIIKSLVIAFASYSRIPMPRFVWKEEDMKYVMTFFPLVGAVTGGLEYLWYLAARHFETGTIAYSIVSLLIPVLITGGFHVDGFMDTADAISSFREKERRLEILKDSHIGAFSVIRLLTAAGLMLAAVSVLRQPEQILLFAISFVLARALSALGVLHFQSAVHAGSLFYTASHSSRMINTITTVLIAGGSILAMVLLHPVCGSLAAGGALLAFLYYRLMSYRLFGGITGDLAGYFVVICEVSAVVCNAAGGLLAG